MTPRHPVILFVFCLLQTRFSMWLCLRKMKYTRICISWLLKAKMNPCLWSTVKCMSRSIVTFVAILYSGFGIIQITYPSHLKWENLNCWYASYRRNSIIVGSIKLSVNWNHNPSTLQITLTQKVYVPYPQVVYALT